MKKKRRRGPLQQVTALINPLFSNGIPLFPPFQPVLEGVIFIRKLLGKFPARCRRERWRRGGVVGLYTTIFEREERKTRGGGSLEISLARTTLG